MSELIHGRYQPLERVGAGGQGEVFRALDRRHDRPVALKVRRLASREERDSILSEARILLSMTPHEGLPLVRDDFFEGDRHYLVMDWIEGPSLREILVRKGAPGLPFDAVLGYVEDVGAALSHLHRHRPALVHRDVKPANIVIGSGERAVLVDFGISAAADARVSPSGTSGYLAPEIVAGDVATPAADVFSLAVTAFVLLTGSLPEPGSPAASSVLPTALRRRLEDALRRGLAMDPAQRPSVPEFVAMLRPSPVPHNLPTQVTSFVEREGEIAEVKRLLSGARLLTLAGAGGSGKTRLALEVAREAAWLCPDGVWLVELAGLSDPELVAQTVAAALGVREQPGRSITAALQEALGAQTALIILDNCEHLLDACAGLVEELLRSCPELRIVATSREPLRVAGETAWRVRSLSVPEPDTPPWAAAEHESVRLFVERARALRPGFELDEDVAPSVIRICRRLDGVPLAIEMAAAGLWSLDPAELAGSLDERFWSLEGSRTALPRQRTLRATLDWSHSLLTEAEQSFFRRLAVFAGRFTREAAGAVCAEDGGPGGLLDRLLDASLVAADERGGEVRLRLVEAVREYAGEKLADANETARANGRHRDWFFELALKRGPELKGAEQRDWLSRFDDAHDNFRAALAWSLRPGGEPERALGLANFLFQFWQTRGHWSEGRRWLERSVDANPEPSPPVADAMSAAGAFAFQLGDRREARALCEGGLAMARSLGVRDCVGRILMNLATMSSIEGDLARAVPLMEESLAIRREAGDRSGVARVLSNLGNMTRTLREPGRARAMYEESLQIARDLGDEGQVAAVLNNLGNLLIEEGDLERAATAQEESLAMRQRIGDRPGIANSLTALGELAERREDRKASRLYREQSLELREELGDRDGVAAVLISMAVTAIDEDEDEEARMLVERSRALGREVGNRWVIATSDDVLARLAARAGDAAGAGALASDSLETSLDLGASPMVASALVTIAELELAADRCARAATLLAASEALGGQGVPARPPAAARRTEELSVRVRECLPEEEIARAWDAGRAMTAEAAVAFARTIR